MSAPVLSDVVKLSRFCFLLRKQNRQITANKVECNKLYEKTIKRPKTRKI